MHELGMKDDLERDNMVQELAVKVAEILGKYETAVDTTAIKAQQDAVRPHNKEMMDGLQETSY
jgi:adenylyl- and sulfurtransferase ThiI